MTNIKLSLKLLFIAFLYVTNSLCAQQANQRPNVILILGDDMKMAHFGFIKGEALTPNLNKMATEGMYFSRTYVPSAACTPTRFSCLTGRFASRCNDPSFINSCTPEGVYAVEWNTGLGYETDVLSKTMKAAGYVTGITGKWHNGASPEAKRLRRLLKYEDDPAEPRVDSILKAMDSAQKEYLKSVGFDYAEAVLYDNYGSHPIGELRYHNQEIITQAAVNFVRQNKDKPFFLYMPTTLMHGPDPFMSLKDDPRKTYTGLLKEAVTVQPSRADVLKRTRAADIADENAAATWLDDGIGVVLNTLKELGIEKNTLIVFMNDQGLDGGKGSCYEGGVRVPSIYYWPGTIKAGSSDALVANIDIYPTICDACNIKIEKENHDGTSLFSIINGKEVTVRDHIFCEFAYTRAIVTDEYKYLAFRLPASKNLTQEQRVALAIREEKRKEASHSDPLKAMPNEPLSHMGFPGGQGTERVNGVLNYPYYYDHDQLYNLKEDPNEQVNLANDEAYQKELEKMKELLSSWVKKMPGNFGEF